MTVQWEKEKKHLQKLRGGEKISSSQVHWVSEHEEEIEMSNQISNELIDDPANREPNQFTDIHPVEVKHVL